MDDSSNLSDVLSLFLSSPICCECDHVPFIFRHPVKPLLTGRGRGEIGTWQLTRSVLVLAAVVAVVVVGAEESKHPVA